MPRGTTRQAKANRAAVYARGSGVGTGRDDRTGTVEQINESVWGVHMNRLLRRKEVEQMVGLSRASLYRLAETGDFPHPVRVGPRAVRWPLRDIEQWISERPLTTQDLRQGQRAG